jgi:hypothetical protein
LAFAQQFAADRPAVAVMFLDQDLRLAALDLEDFRDRIGDSDGKAAAFFEGPAPGRYG